jgi:hypothetical protein
MGSSRPGVHSLSGDQPQTEKQCNLASVQSRVMYVPYVIFLGVITVNMQPASCQLPEVRSQEKEKWKGQKKTLRSQANRRWVLALQGMNHKPRSCTVRSFVCSFPPRHGVVSTVVARLDGTTKKASILPTTCLALLALASCLAAWNFDRQAGDAQQKRRQSVAMPLGIQ